MRTALLIVSLISNLLYCIAILIVIFSHLKAKSRKQIQDTEIFAWVALILAIIVLFAHVFLGRELWILVMDLIRFIGPILFIKLAIDRQRFYVMSEVERLELIMRQEAQEFQAQALRDLNREFKMPS